MAYVLLSFCLSVVMLSNFQSGKFQERKKKVSGTLHACEDCIGIDIFCVLVHQYPVVTLVDTPLRTFPCRTYESSFTSWRFTGPSRRPDID